MKNFLSLLSVLTISGIAMPMVIAASPYQKQENKIKKIFKKVINFKNVNSMISNDSKIYFGTDSGLFVLESGSTEPQKISEINSEVSSIGINGGNLYIGFKNGAARVWDGNELLVVSSKISGDILYTDGFNVFFSDGYIWTEVKVGENEYYPDLESLYLSEWDTHGFNINFFTRNDNKDYFATDSGAYVLKDSEHNPTKIDGINNKVNSIVFDSNDNSYFATDSGAFVLKQGTTTAIKINKISDIVYCVAINSKNNLYFGTDSGLFVLESGSTEPQKISEINNSIKLITINSNNVYFTTSEGIYILENIQETKLSKENEIFEKWYKFLEHDELKIEFNFNTVNNISVLFENNKKQEFIKELKTIINNIPKSDHSGGGGSITEEDINIVVNLIWQHFSDFHETYKNMTENQKLIIKTNTIGYWDNDNANNSIYIN